MSFSDSKDKRPVFTFLFLKTSRFSYVQFVLFSASFCRGIFLLPQVCSSCENRRQALSAITVQHSLLCSKNFSCFSILECYVYKKQGFFSSKFVSNNCSVLYFNLEVNHIFPGRKNPVKLNLYTGEIVYN